MSSANKIKVLHIITSFGMGGAETWLLNLLKYYRQHPEFNIELQFLCTSGKKGLLDDEIFSNGGIINYIQLDKKNIFSFLTCFRKLLKSEKFNAVHDHQDYLSGWHYLFGKGLLPAVRVAHVHNPAYQLFSNYGVTARRKFQLTLGKYLLRKLTTHIGGTSEKILKEYGINKNEFPNQWIGAMHCAFDISNFKNVHGESKSRICREFGWSDSVKIILFAGRLDCSLDEMHPQNHKNSVFALRVLYLIKDADIKLIYAGDNKCIVDEFSGLIEELGLEDRVKLLGIRRDMVNLMAGADLLFFPSRAEGLGMVAVEAQAAGLPVVASTAVPEECMVIKELVHFYSLADWKQEWADRISAVLNKGREDDTAKDIEWGVTDFNISVSAKKLAEVYRGKPYDI